MRGDRERERDGDGVEEERDRAERDDPPSPETPTEPSPLTAFIYFMSLDNIAFLTLSPLDPLTFLLCFCCSCFFFFKIYYFFTSILFEYLGPSSVLTVMEKTRTLIGLSAPEQGTPPLPGWFYDHLSNVPLRPSIPWCFNPSPPVPPSPAFTSTRWLKVH